VAARTSTDASARLNAALERLGARRTDARRTVSLARQLDREAESGHLALDLIRCVSDVLGRPTVDHAWRRGEVRRLVAPLAEMTGLPAGVIRRELHAGLARDPRIVQLSPAVAVETHLKVLFALTDVAYASLWTSGPLEPLTCVFHAGPTKPPRRARAVARSVLEQGRPDRLGSAHGIAVVRWQRPEAALVVETSGDDDHLALAGASGTAASLSLVLEREALLARNASRERALVDAGERLLTRIGFDLHDGAIQDVAALAADIELFRGQLEHVLASNGSGGQRELVGRIGDLQARVVAVDRALRDMVHSLESPTVMRRPLEEMLRKEVEALRAQTEIKVDLALRGEFEEITDSQRRAILRIVQESFTNIREHSNATQVGITVLSGPSELTAEIRDDGRGFDVERTLVRAARAGRFGLVGMSERVRLLGGRFDVRSRPGGPTTISLVLPAWRPATVEAPRGAALNALSLG
jgi:signal transduction histidine kinase